ncbi:DUF4049 domain-containing protein [Escherichia albertii]|uniref:DUF4049 domain-containing protein n=1 Tax=Escherichia albertii TaxID=208962 RepID=UPI001374F443|nr:DUF4049 domain-containing protein [Escherichia albertii]
MKVFKMISRTINSNHEDKHSKSKKVNYDQYNENVDKKKISTTVEIKMLDNIFDMGGDLGLHILYFLQNGGWNGHDAYHNTVKAWFYSSEPTVDLQEYNNFRQMIYDKFIFTISPDNRNVLKTMPPITFKIKSKGNFYLLNISVDNTEIIYKMKEPFINIQNFFTLLSGNFKPDWSWTVSTDPLTDRDFDSAIASAFSWRKYFTQCGAINRKSANTAYFGDTDGCVGAVLYALLVSGHIGIQERGWGLLKELLLQEEYALRSCNNNSMVSHYKFKCYVIGAITVAISEMKDACDPIELAEIINKKYHGIINDKDFKSSRALPHLTSNQYFSCSTNYRPGREDILKCSNILSINQIIAHNGNGGKELIGKTGAVLGLNARDYKHPNKLFSLHNCQINLDSALEEATPWRVYQHEKNKAKPLPDFRKSTMLWL